MKYQFKTYSEEHFNLVVETLKKRGWEISGHFEYSTTNNNNIIVANTSLDHLMYNPHRFDESISKTLDDLFANEDLLNKNRNFSIKIKNPDHFRWAQHILFDKGYEWLDSARTLKRYPNISGEFTINLKNIPLRNMLMTWSNTVSYELITLDELFEKL